MTGSASVDPSSARAFARVRESGGAELAERLEHLDALRAAPRTAATSSPAEPATGDTFDADVIIAGGGLWLLLAPILAARGHRVIVCERGRAGVAHREWNASGPELRALVRVGLVTEAELESMIVARYREGTCSFGTNGESAVYPVLGVLDHAVDAGSLLGHARALAEARGVTICDETVITAESASDHGVRVRTRARDGSHRDLTARVLVDARGVASPHASADLVCPTVGGVLTGLHAGTGPKQMDPTRGEILATIDPIERGRQHVWEAFPGRAGETTVYLFYYAESREPARLVDLYARFFATLGDYKTGEARLVRPTFGYIPGWSRLGAAPKSPHGRIVLVGDAAARHSPLTYCGFGATLRSLDRAATSVDQIAREPGRLAASCVVDDAPIHVLTGVLSKLMSSRKLEGDSLNALLDAAFGTLFEMGNDAYASLLRDEMSTRDFLTFLEKVARRHPAVWRHVVRVLGPMALGRWGMGLARSVWSAAP